MWVDRKTSMEFAYQHEFHVIKYRLIRNLFVISDTYFGINWFASFCKFFFIFFSSFNKYKMKMHTNQFFFAVTSRNAYQFINLNRWVRIAKCQLYLHLWEINMPYLLELPHLFLFMHIFFKLNQQNNKNSHNIELLWEFFAETDFLAFYCYGNGSQFFCSYSYNLPYMISSYPQHTPKEHHDRQ